MSEQNLKINESNIISEEEKFQLFEHKTDKNKKDYKTFLKPKVLILIACFFALILVSFALLKTSNKPQDKPVIDPNIVIATPLSQNKIKTIDPEIQKELDAFSKKVENLQNNKIDLSPPVIDYKSLATF